MGKDFATFVDHEGRRQGIDKTTGEVRGIGFGMIDFSIISDIQFLIAKYPSAAEVLFFLIGQSNKDNEITLTQKEICRVSGFSRSKVQRALRVLIEANFIANNRKNQGVVINDRVIWRKAQGEKSSSSVLTGKITFKE